MVTVNEITVLVVLIFLSGAFSASETALVSLSRFKVRIFLDHKRRGSTYLHNLKENPHKMLSTLLICNNVVNIFASVLAANMALQIFKVNALAIATAIMTFVILIFGEIVPKNLATVHNGRISLIVAPIIYILSLVLYPLIVIFDFITTKIFRIKLINTKITEEEVRSIVDIAKEEGGIDKAEKEMIHNIFKFDDIAVDAIKIPRVDMVSIKSGKKLKDALKLVQKKSFSRLPVYEGTNDKIIGIFYYKDTLPFIQKKKFDESINTIMRKPLFIPKTKKIDETLKFFQHKKQQMAIIVDEHGGVTGLVTMEDILEEIVGEITDETDKVEPEIKKIDKKTWKVLGKTIVEDVNKKIKTRFKIEKDYDTLSGYILDKLGRIPKVGEEIELTKTTITVKKLKEHRIIEVVIKKK